MHDPDAPFFVADPILGTQVIYAPKRAERSNAFAHDARELPVGPCPFCPGNEAETPPEVWAVRPDRSLPDTPGWQLRVVPNRYPAVGSPPQENSFDTGRHEVLIETAEHDVDWATMPVEQLTSVLQGVQRSLRSYEADHRLQCAQIFKNVGTRSGASLAHPHLQLLALSKAPNSQIRELQRSIEWRHKTGEDYWGCLIDTALEEGRAVVRDDEFVSLCPPVSRVPYEAWVLPTQAAMYWSHGDASTMTNLARHLRQLIRQVHGSIGPIAHNLIWRLPPLRDASTPGYRWRLELLPRLTTFGGFELGAGIYSNPIVPARAAATLRGEMKLKPPR